MHHLLSVNVKSTESPRVFGSVMRVLCVTSSIQSLYYGKCLSPKCQADDYVPFVRLKKAVKKGFARKDHFGSHDDTDRISTER